jgi:hypothetical protein
MRTTLATAILVAVVLAASVASADAKAVAKRHFDAGFALWQSEDYSGAIVEFTESLRLYKTKSAFFNLANCYKALKRFGETLATLDQLENELGAKLDEEMKAAIATMRKEIDLTTGWLEVRVDRAGASVFVDGTNVGQSPLPSRLILGPGSHDVSARIGEMWTFTQTVPLLSGEKKRVDLSFGAAQAPQPVAMPVQEAPSYAQVEEPRQLEAPRDADSISTQRKWGQGLLWSGLILIVVGGVSTGVAVVHGKRVSDTANYKPDEERKLSRLWSGFMWVGYGLGAAFIATGIPLLVSAKKKEASSSLALTPLFDGQTAGLIVSGEW